MPTNSASASHPSTWVWPTNDASSTGSRVNRGRGPRRSATGDARRPSARAQPAGRCGSRASVRRTHVWPPGPITGSPTMPAVTSPDRSIDRRAGAPSPGDVRSWTRPSAVTLPVIRVDVAESASAKNSMMLPKSVTVPPASRSTYCTVQKLSLAHRTACPSAVSSR